MTSSADACPVLEIYLSSGTMLGMRKSLSSGAVLGKIRYVPLVLLPLRTHLRWVSGGGGRSEARRFSLLEAGAGQLSWQWSRFSHLAQILLQTFVTVDR